MREDIVPFAGTGTLQIVRLLQRPTPDSSQRQKTVPAKESCETPIFNEKPNKKKKSEEKRTKDSYRQDSKGDLLTRDVVGSRDGIIIEMLWKD